MYLSRITLENIRNLENAQLELSPTLNVVYGQNASGKSSFLEAVHILSSGRSFRSRHFKDIITYEQNNCLVAGAVVRRQTPIPLGFQRQGDQVNIHINRQVVNKSSLLAQHLPLQLIHPQSDELIIGGPTQRRRFLDWGVFHVEPSFHAAWQNYQHALKQRNAAIKSRLAKDQIELWNQPLAEKAFAIHQHRKTYFQQLRDAVDQLQQAFFQDAVIQIDYKPGWPTQEDLVSLLKQNFTRDYRFGATQLGPHKADIRILADGHKAAEHLSRGQLKNLLILLVLSQIKTLHQHQESNCLVLIDDLLSELDDQRADSILQLLQSLNTQLIITAIEKDQAIRLKNKADAKLFHVEQGVISEFIE